MIRLDSEIPPLDGKRVHVMIDPIEESEIELSPEEQIRLWQEWVAKGPQGAIAEDEDLELR